MFKKLLLPVDVAHLDEGRKALEVAESITSPDASITLLYVMEDIPNRPGFDLPPGFKKKSLKAARKAIKSITKSSDRAVKVETRIGHAYRTILKEAKALNIDLIVLASHKPGLKEYFIGSNTSKVVSHANCSVFVVRG